jgi:hypothetical protein
MGPAKIHIDRDCNRWVDRFRVYKVLIDGEPAGEIRRGESRCFKVAPGRHQLRLTIDWTASETIDLDLEPGVETRVQCAPSRYPPLGQLLGMLRISPYIRLSKGDSSKRRPVPASL